MRPRLENAGDTLQQPPRDQKRMKLISTPAHTVDASTALRILDDLKNGNPESLSVEAFTRYMALSYGNATHGVEMRNVMWSWVHLLEFSDEQISHITSDVDVPIYDDGDPDNTLYFHERSDRERGSDNGPYIFCCGNNNPVILYSEQMLDAAFNMTSLTGNHLMYLLDNYILGSESMEDQELIFNTLENRNRIFASEHLNTSVISFMKESKSCEFEDSPILDIEEQEFISSTVAKGAFERLIAGDNLDTETYSYDIRISSLLSCGEILCHLDDEAIARLVEVAHTEGIDLTSPEVLAHERIHAFLASNPNRPLVENIDAPIQRKDQLIASGMNVLG